MTRLASEPAKCRRCGWTRLVPPVHCSADARRRAVRTGLAAAPDVDRLLRGGGGEAGIPARDLRRDRARLRSDRAIAVARVGPLVPPPSAAPGGTRARHD